MPWIAAGGRDAAADFLDVLDDGQLVTPRIERETLSRHRACRSPRIEL